MNKPGDDLSLLIQQTQQGDLGAKERLFELLIQELRASAQAMMRRERVEHTLQPSALLNEAMVRILSSSLLQQASDRRYLFAAANQAMQRVLVDHARRRSREKRSAERLRSSLDDVIETLESRDKTTIFELTDALSTLKAKSSRQAEIVELRFFSGLSIEEISTLVELSPATVKRELTLGKAKLYRLLRCDEPTSPLENSDESDDENCDQRLWLR